ncbi:MAG: PP2C family serine/threonine-protein phosphatase [Chitinophagales bacterium]
MNEITNNNKWLVVGASVIGKSHIADDVPCQDSHLYKLLENGWGIAVVADGAGSAVNSDKGSDFVVKASVKAFSQLLQKELWHINQTLPSEVAWSIAARETLKEVRAALDFFAEENEWEVSSLASTVIVVIFSPIGILVTHIGDGRAAFQEKESKEWHPAMIPHKGTEANQTVFITSAIWQEEELELSGVKVPESRVIPISPLSFALLSDGCEKHSFECSRFNDDLQKWSDPNQPFTKFFSPLTSNLSSAIEHNASVEDIEVKWESFLKGGTKGLKQEGDDKTMILGVFCP